MLCRLWCTAIVLRCAEGDNFGDGLRMARAATYALSTSFGHTRAFCRTNASDAKEDALRSIDLDLAMPSVWKRIERDTPTDLGMY